jgi:hypothetical protein
MEIVIQVRGDQDWTVQTAAVDTYSMPALVNGLTHLIVVSHGERCRVITGTRRRKKPSDAKTDERDVPGEERGMEGR